jgi:TetR/AcrR family transcriptional regulator, transcriptional repressor for nem operon
MRYAKGHKEATRKQIARIASGRFRRDGVEAVGVASLMADAGLTHGGFYSHFSSKEELVREAVVGALERKRGQLAQAGAEGGLEGILRAYLRPAHRDAPARGCAFASLAAEIARHPPSTRAAFTREFEAHVALIADHLPHGDRAVALAIFSAMIGALQLARTVSDANLSDRILESATRAALTLAAGAAPPSSLARPTA